jgi:hypothetical protein
MQAHHLDTDYYDKFFRPGAYGPTHAAPGDLASLTRQGADLHIMASLTPDRYIVE